MHEIEDKVIEKMRNAGVFEMPDFEVSISSAIAETNIFMVLHMEKGGLIPISGFPRNLLKDYPGNLRCDSHLLEDLTANEIASRHISKEKEATERLKSPKHGCVSNIPRFSPSDRGKSRGFQMEIKIR